MSDNTNKRKESAYSGSLSFEVTSFITSTPVQGAQISVFYSEGPGSVIERLETDGYGQAGPVFLPAPPPEYSLDPLILKQPYSEYTLQITAPGYESVEISGAQIFPEVSAVQEVKLYPLVTPGPEEEVVDIPAHTLFGDYPPKIAEQEIKPGTDYCVERVLSRVVVPEYIVVHDGVPRDITARNYYVKYKNYIKNVACSEIYATWPANTIRANVLAIMSFTLNRVYTEWYRNMGFDFTITSSTAFDQKWIPGRNIYRPIAEIVDELYGDYLARPNVCQPILTQYCDGRRVKCPGWMSQWGSKRLGDEGYSASEIFRYYYGSDMYINTAEPISGIPASWPGYDLRIGDRGRKVRQVQEQLNGIGKAYPALPKIAVDGIYGPATAGAVKIFQSVFGLPRTGEVDYRTWYKISLVYVAVTRIAELR